MTVSKALFAAVAAATVGLSAVGAGVASAQPFSPAPQQPGRGHGHGNDDWCGPPWCDGHGNGPGGPGAYPGGWDKGPWWAANRHDWWDDRQGPPPWGWGPPPPLQWNGGPLPQNVNYWGYNANPVWDDGFRQWGIWLFGIWVPIFGVGFA
jgi:hypothetical protein